MEDEVTVVEKHSDNNDSQPVVGTKLHYHTPSVLKGEKKKKKKKKCCSSSTQ